MPFESHFLGFERVFLPAFAKALSLVFYLESAMFYNKEKVALFGIRLNIKEIE